jgi:hypothetical protein
MLIGWGRAGVAGGGIWGVGKKKKLDFMRELSVEEELDRVFSKSEMPGSGDHRWKSIYSMTLNYV